MNTTVINIKTLPHGWQTLREYADHVFIGRATPGLLPPFTFGNGFRVGDRIEDEGITSATPADCLRLYENHLVEKLRDFTAFRMQVRALHGKTLVCFCDAPALCHGTILARVADELAAEAKALLATLPRR